MKLSFEVEVIELANYCGNKLGIERQGQVIAPEDIDITLDAGEHGDWAWVTEEEVRGEGKYDFVSDEQRGVVLEGFRLGRVGSGAGGCGCDGLHQHHHGRSELGI